jgi:hypothetical protein
MAPLDDMPPDFKCPLSYNIMTDPVSPGVVNALHWRSVRPRHNQTGRSRQLRKTRDRHLQVVLVETGIRFQRRAIEDWFARCGAAYPHLECTCGFHHGLLRMQRKDFNLHPPS